MNVRLFVLVFTVYALFWNLGAKPLAEWDESRYGQIALEMLRNCGGLDQSTAPNLRECDIVNYYYNGEPEFWVAKPPLNAWSIATSYKLFGLNEFAIRLPATIAGIIALYFLFQFLSLYLKPDYVWYAMVVAITTKALIGPHISRSADTDAFLLAGGFPFLFYFARFFREERGMDLVWAGIALGLAFFAKALAIGFFLPVGLFFLFWKDGWKKLVRNKYFYIGVVAFALIPAIWISVLAVYGNKDPTKQFGGSAIEVMVFFDVIGRLTGAIDSGRSRIDLAYLPRAMEIRFGVWWTLLCAWALIIFFRKFRSNEPAISSTTIFQNDTYRRESVLLSLFCMLSLLSVFFISVVKLDWYLAPLLPFFCVLFLFGYEKVASAYPKTARTLVLLGLLVAVGNQVRYVSLDDTDSPIRDFVQANRVAIQEAKSITPSRRLTQDEMLYVSWVHQKPIAKPTQTDRLIDKFALDCREGDCILSLP